MREALSRLKALLEDPSVLKVAQNLKYDYLLMKRHGITVQGFDDTMLMSYVVDAGNGTHGMDALSERWLGHKPLAYKDMTGSGKSSVTFDYVDIDRATAYAAEDAEVTLRLWHVLKPRLVVKGLVRVYERLERPLVPVLAHMEERGITIDRQILSRLSGELAQGAAALEDEIYKLAGENIHHRLAQAARRYPLRQDGAARRFEDQDRPMVDLGAGARGSRGGGPRTAAQDRRLAPDDQVEVDLYGRLAGFRPSGNETRPHLLCAGGDDDGTPVLVRPEPAEHPGAHRRRPQDPHGLHCHIRSQAGFGRLQPDRTARACPCRRHPAAVARPLPMASTFTR